MVTRSLHVLDAADVILRTRNLAELITPTTPGRWGAERSGAIRTMLRALAWTKVLRVTAGGSLGPLIEWQRGQKPRWHCERYLAERDTSGHYVPHCMCRECCAGVERSRAVQRRVHYALQLLFAAGHGREFGDRSDISTDYFDSDYTFYPQ